MNERDVEAYLVRRVNEVGGQVRKVQWIGRRNAPDRLVMLPSEPTRPARTLWVELKNPRTILTFPTGGHERAQAREHEAMRALGQSVHVVGTKDQVEELLR